jgi:hypothetical protein
VRICKSCGFGSLADLEVLRIRKLYGFVSCADLEVKWMRKSNEAKGKERESGRIKGRHTLGRFYLLFGSFPTLQLEGTLLVHQEWLPVRKEEEEEEEEEKKE